MVAQIAGMHMLHGEAILSRAEGKLAYCREQGMGGLVGIVRARFPTWTVCC
jgi:hypothetical protein